MITFPANRMRSKKGFTLIELLVVTGISALLLLTVTSLFATFLMSNVRTNLRRQVHEEGNAAIQRIEFLIRNAQSVDCIATDTNATAINIVSLAGEQMRIDLSSNRIRTRTGNPLGNDQFLTSAGVQVPNNSLRFNCSHNPTIISVGFTISTLAANENQHQQRFNTRVLVRNTAF